MELIKLLFVPLSLEIQAQQLYDLREIILPLCGERIHSFHKQDYYSY